MTCKSGGIHALNTIHFDSVSNDAPDLRALTTSACLTRPPGTSRTVTSVTTPLSLRPKLWTKFQGLELSGNMVPCTPGSSSGCARNGPITQVIHRHLRSGTSSRVRATCCQDDGESNLTDEMAYRHFNGKVSPERDDPARDDPEKDDPERDDQFSMSFDDQFSRSSDEKEYLSPHRMVILNNISRKIFYIYSNNLGKNPMWRS